MKQKYTLSIADMEINVITDQSPESVEYIVGILDRKMREIGLKSKRCTKNEAAVLCALDLCADKIRLKEEKEELEDSIADLTDKLEHLEEKYELLQKNADRLEKERARLEVENNNLRNGIDSAADISEDTSAAIEPEDEPAAEAEPVREERTPKKKMINKSRVGSMFDLLTFTDI
jgi:cell division protein ZapA (FtsZ GTPase activity inhibitor)